jgi:hypothetical protein
MEEGKTWAQVRQLRKELADERLCKMHCAVCLFPFKQFELEKSIPFRMVMLYKKHIQFRGKQCMNLQHLRVTSPEYLA